MQSLLYVRDVRLDLTVRESESFARNVSVNVSQEEVECLNGRMLFKDCLVA